MLRYVVLESFQNINYMKETLLTLCFRLTVGKVLFGALV